MRNDVLTPEPSLNSSYVIYVDTSVQTKYVKELSLDEKATSLITNYLNETVGLFKRKRHELFFK